MLEKERKFKSKANGLQATKLCQKNELETLFVDCIEDVRKDIIKRRLKNEVYNRKKFQGMDKHSTEAKEFEDSLLRLAQLSKNRVQITDFTHQDRYHLLDLFVNNEKTLLKIYEALFPHRVTSIAPIKNNTPMPQSQMTSRNEENLTQANSHRFGKRPSNNCSVSDNSTLGHFEVKSYSMTPGTAAHLARKLDPRAITMRNQSLLDSIRQKENDSKNEFPSLCLK